MTGINKKVLLFDLETSNLDADFGTLLCVGWKWLGEKQVHTLSIGSYPTYGKDATDDKGIVKDFLKVYSQADLTVAYNGILFDRPWLLTKCLEHNLQLPPNIPMQDPYWTVKSNTRMSRKSLQKVAEHLELGVEKTPVEGKIWRRASAGHLPSLKYIVAHCKADVLVLEAAYLRLRPLMRTHYRLSDDMGRCRYCNSSRLQSRGRTVTKNKAPQRRVYCTACSGWDTRTLKEVKKFKIGGN